MKKINKLLALPFRNVLAQSHIYTPLAFSLKLFVAEEAIYALAMTLVLHTSLVAGNV